MRRRRLRILGLALLLAVPDLAQAAGARPAVADLVARDDPKALAALGPAALPEMVRLYTSGDDEQKIRVANLLYKLGRLSRDAEQALLRDVHSPNPSLRIAVQYALGRVSDDPKVVDTLLEIMRHDGSPVFRDKAACALSYDQIHLTEAQKFDLETMSDRIGIRFRSIQKVIESDGSYERLLASTDRLREEIAASEATLDRLLTLRSGYIE